MQLVQLSLPVGTATSKWHVLLIYLTKLLSYWQSLSFKYNEVPYRTFIIRTGCCSKEMIKRQQKPNKKTPNQTHNGRYATQVNQTCPEHKISGFEACFTPSSETSQTNKNDKIEGRSQVVFCLHNKAVDFIYFSSRYNFSDKPQSTSDG